MRHGRYPADSRVHYGQATKGSKENVNCKVELCASQAEAVKGDEAFQL